jgi:hypothetical protein
MRISVCKGLVWLLIATAAEVPPTVRLTNLLRLAPVFIVHRYVMS